MTPHPLLQKAIQNAHAIINNVFEHPPQARALLIFDNESPLARLLAQAYQENLPQAQCIIFNESTKEAILESFNTLSPGDLVVLIQSSSFRLDEFRIRIHLFNLQLKVMELPHLGRVLENEFETYIDSLAYDSEYYHEKGESLKSRIDKAKQIELLSGKEKLVYGGSFEPAMLNIGDYRKTKNSGGQFPIGEVFTELKELTQLNGKIGVFAFGNRDFSVYFCKTPIILTINEGKIIHAENSVPDFDAILEDIRSHENVVWVRELGFGLNRALTEERRIVKDVGIYERMCGIHLSIGGKHSMYRKEGFTKKTVKYHVDIFPVVNAALIDGEKVFENGVYL